MDKETFNDIVNSFRSMYKKNDIIIDYVNYYKALMSWVGKYMHLFSDEQIENGRFDVLINLDPDTYVISDPEILLEKEYKRIGERIYESIDDLIMSISDTLWDLVTIRSGVDCPNCIYDELRYVIAENKEKNTHEILLECETCGWTQHIGGGQWREGIVKIIPASLEDVNHVKK